jgi:hypothetical protein
MKKLLIASIIGLLPAVISASERKINCDDFAKHIENELKKKEHGMNGFYGAYYYQKTNFFGMPVGKPELCTSYFINGTCEVTYKKRNCKAAGEEGDSYAIILLPGRIALFKQYHNALKQCAETSEDSCPLAAQTMRKLEEKMDMCSQCIDLYNQGKAEASKKDKEEKVRKDAFDKLINDTNKK